MPSKTELTRERILDAALELFLEGGFDATTVAEIATAAGVSEMTFFRYFGSKDAVVLDDPYDPFIASAIASQPQGLPPIARAAAGIRAAWQRLPEPADQRTKDRIRIAAGSPALQAGMWKSNGATERAIAEQLATDGADPLAAKVAASACLAALMAAILDWSRAESGPLGERVQLALDIVTGSA